MVTVIIQKKNVNGDIYFNYCYLCFVIVIEKILVLELIVRFIQVTVNKYQLEKNPFIIDIKFLTCNNTYN